MEPKHYSIFSDILYFINYFHKYEPILLLLCAAEIVLGTFIPLIGIYLPKITLDLVVQGANVWHAMMVLGLFTLMMISVRAVHALASAGKYHLYNSQRVNQVGLLFLKSLRIPYPYTESGDMKKVYWKAFESLNWGDWSASSRMVTGTVGITVNILCFLLYSGVIGMLNVWLLICLTVLAFLNYLINLGQIRYEESLRDEKAQVNKHYYCVLNSMGNVMGAKDIRIFGMSHWLICLRDIVLDENRRVNWKIFKKRSLYEKLGFLLSFARDMGAYCFLLWRAFDGAVSASEFVLYFGAVTGFSGFVTSIMNNLSELREAANSADYLRTYMELPEEKLHSGTRHIEELDMPIEIKFENVSFSYHDASEDIEENDGMEEKSSPIFEHLNLTIHAGEKIALVGVNGAGKTTFVKLLCGMYDPDEGKILINGIDRNEFPREELYQLFSVVFQEQLILPFTVGENLVLQKEDTIDTERAWDALEKAGLKSIFEDKGIRMDSFMTKKLVKDGVELSGGQQQRFMLARALYKDAPVLILDEPTAALDPIAESEIYNDYSKYSGGKTSLFISHRLASTRFSDRIVLFEDGKNIESGTHDELMGQNGKYAEMFRIQSNYYNSKKKEEGVSGYGYTVDK